MLNLRATQLEKFRRFICEASEFETEESLMETLTGKFEGNEYTRIGTAFHKVIEIGTIETSCKLNTSGYNVIFNPNHLAIALAYKQSIKGCFHEIRANKVYDINGTKINVSGGADVVLGNQIRDIKTKYSPLKSISDYTDSVQWKLYCDIFELPEFYFDVFEFKGYDKEKHGYDVSGLALVKHDPIHCIEYSGMQKDIHVLLTEFLNFVKFRKIEHLFYERHL
jgi:hypothetical protein